MAKGSPGIVLVRSKFSPPLAPCPEKRPVTRVSLTCHVVLPRAATPVGDNAPSAAIDTVFFGMKPLLDSGKRTTSGGWQDTSIQLMKKSFKAVPPDSTSNVTFAFWVVVPAYVPAMPVAVAVARSRASRRSGRHGRNRERQSAHHRTRFTPQTTPFHVVTMVLCRVLARGLSERYRRRRRRDRGTLIRSCHHGRAA